MRIETHYTVTKKIRHCKKCSAKCKKNPPIVGCESIMIPIPPLEVEGKMYVTECARRTWFDKDYFPIEFWRFPTEKEFNELRDGQWEKILQNELEQLQRESKKCAEKSESQDV